VSVSTDEQAAHSDVDHGGRDVDATFVIAHQAAPACHPAKGSLYDLSAWQNLNPLLVITPPNDLKDEIEIGGLVHQL
jgi:hypothetical protein